MKPHVYIARHDLDIAHQRHQQGETWEVIAADIGVSRTALTNRLRSLGYDFAVVRKEQSAPPEDTTMLNSTAVKMLSRPLGANG